MEKRKHDDRDNNHLEVFGGIFPSRQAAEEFFALEDGRPRRFMEALCLQGDFTGSIEIAFFDKKSNNAEELFAGFPCGDRIVEVLRQKFWTKLKRRVNTAIVIYDFDLRHHFSNRPARVMQENKTEDHHVFSIDCVYPYH